jgi:hypothetical protein
MLTFWQRLVYNNAQFLAGQFRRWADQLDAAAPGPPVVAFPILFITGKEISVGHITVRDSTAPIKASVTFKDAAGHDTAPEGLPTWTSSDEAVATVVASEDGLSAEVTAGSPGAAVIEVKEVDNAGQEIVSQGTVTVQPGDAVIGEIHFEGEDAPAVPDQSLPGDQPEINPL